ncbi:MAG: hypothetical protein OJF47_003909 [Nitrospira sp.]|nr:MAG: hypothetical protein OJF47_003909 [Nitrospira sp.]
MLAPVPAAAPSPESSRHRAKKILRLVSRQQIAVEEGKNDAVG